MAKFRVYEIAKKYNKDNKEILEILKANHVEVKNHMSTIGDEQIKMIDNETIRKASEMGIIDVIDAVNTVVLSSESSSDSFCS